jgi:hypothetical protein
MRGELASVRFVFERILQRRRNRSSAPVTPDPRSQPFVASSRRRDDDLFRPFAPGEFRLVPRRSNAAECECARQTFQIGDLQT